jgi:hypothetical protein
MKIIREDKLTAKEIRERKALLQSRKTATPKQHDVTEQVRMVKDKRPIPPDEVLTVSGIRKTPLCSGDWVDSACNTIETNRLEVDAINVRGRKAIKRRKVC